MLKVVEDGLDARDLLVYKEEESILEFNLLSLGVSHEVGGNVATVPSEAFNIFNFSLKSLAVSDSDCAIRAELLEYSSKDVSNIGISIC